MKKKTGSRIGGVLKRIFRVREWIDWERIRSWTLYLINGLKRLFIPQHNVASESFNAAMTRLKISEADLLAKQKGLYWLSIIMVLTATFILFYTGYQLFYGTFKAAVVSIVVMMIALVLAFRYHFWYFQIKKRKLGCTLKEWYRQGLLGED